MWVSRSEWESLTRRVEWLEKNRVSPEETAFTVYDPAELNRPYSFYRELPREMVPVKTAVSKIMDKLGMTFEYVKGQPTKVDIAFAASSAAVERSQEPK